MTNEHRQTVLVVDDEESGREVVCRKLQRSYGVVSVGSGPEALERIDAEPVDLVILDVMMPGLDGFETCRRIKDKARDRFIPVILVTALRDQENRNRGLAAGADEFLSKPVDTQELRLRVRALLRLREQEETIREQARSLELANRRLKAHSEELETAVRERTRDLERQNCFTSQIIDSLPVSLYVVDRQRTVVAWNRTREMGRLGLPREEALGKSVFDLFRKKPREEIDAELIDVFDSGKTLTMDCESNADGELRHYRIHKVPMFLEPGEPTHVLTIGEEITEQQRLQKSMAMAEKMAAVGRVAAGVAHEVNNPLATIVTCAEGLQSRLAELPPGPGDSDDFREYLEIVRQEAFRAKKITADLLDFSRVKRAERRRCHVEEILERTLLVLKHHSGFERVELKRSFEPELPGVEVDEDSLVQVFLALIINALDSMGDGGRLALAVRSEGEDILCEVRDNGGGISTTDLPRIFEPFFTTKPSGRGTGLGLAVCYGIVRAHGGRIDVESTAGEGSRFTVVLPAARTVHDTVAGAVS